MIDLTPAAALTLFKFGYNSFEISAKRDVPEHEVCRLLTRARADERARFKHRMKRKSILQFRGRA